MTNSLRRDELNFSGETRRRYKRRASSHKKSGMIRFRIFPRAPVFALSSIVFAFTSSLFATDYYLGSLAADQGGIAVSDIAALNALALKPADRVFFQGGEMFYGTIEIGPEDAGSAAQPVVLTSFGNGRASIVAGNNSALKISNAAGLSVSKLNLIGAGKDTNTCSGIDAGAYLPDSTKLDYLHFEQMQISGFHVGVEIWAWYSTSLVAWPGFRDVSLVGLEVFANCSEGIKTWGTWHANGNGTNFSHSDFYIADCVVYNNKGDPASTSHTGSGIILSGVDRGVIENCVAHDNGGLGPTSGGGPFGIWIWESRSCTLQNDLVYNQRTSGSLDGGAYDLDGGSSNSTVQYCYSYNNDGPAVGLIQFHDASPLVNNTVRYNISENDCRKTSQGILYVGEYSTIYGIDGADIYGNTFFISTNPRGGNPVAANVENKSLVTNVRIRNNLFYATHAGLLIGGAVTNPAIALYQGNDYWGGTFDLTAFRAGGQEILNGQPVGMRIDPQLNAPGQGGALTDPLTLSLTTAYQLQATSPVNQAGLDLIQLFNLDPGPRDFFNQPIASASLPVGASCVTSSNIPAPDPAPVPPPATTPPPSTSSALVDDEFTGSGSLGGRIPDTAAVTGQKWSVLTGSISAGAGYATSGNTARTIINVGAADGTVASTLNFDTGGAGLILRCSDSSNYLRVTMTSGALTVSKTQAGNTSELLAVKHAFPLGQSYRLKATLSASSIVVAVDDVVYATLTSTFNQTATAFGLLASNSGTRNWDNFVFTAETHTSATDPGPTPDPAPGSTGTVSVDDEFAGSGNLAGRVPDTTAITGQKWAVFTGAISVSSGFAVTTNTVRAVVDVGAADGSLDSTVELDSGASGLILRCSDSSNYLRATLTSGALTIGKTEAGVTSNMLVVTHSFALGQTYRVHVTLSGSSVAVAVDDIALASVTSAFNQTATRFGLLASNTGTRRWDRFCFTQ